MLWPMKGTVLYYCLKSAILINESRYSVYYTLPATTHSDSVETHAQYLRVVFQRIRNAGLTLRGAKCHIRLSSANYLGHVFSAKGMSADPSKAQDITDWPVPTNATKVCQFLGLASYYR